ncbi:MAG: EF-P lysine aminoacylase GenX [Kiritimatiellae bacterium]|nr:EF-P lysine aminoacylase GenX [Kiritimatiellia bacterium]
MGGLVENLMRRAEILRAVRAFFEGRGFSEVVTPVLISAPAPEPHIDCPPCGRGYLRASPELQMKKLLAAGMDKIYQIGPCFRDGELGARHNPEFTMIEWYRLGATYLDIATDAESLLREIMPGSATPSRITVREAYLKWAGWDPWTEWNQDRFDCDMATKIEPNLPKSPVFLMDYPKEAASLARLRGDVAERWELYFGGVELANCFTELCDGEEQKKRFLAAKDERRRLGESDYPIDGEFLDLLPLVVSAAGVALGIDRLVALALGETDIHAVMCGE